MSHWTVGFAVYDDPNNQTEGIRAAMTAMSLLIHHPEVKEVIVVDNNPYEITDPGTKLKYNPLARFVTKTGRGRYVPMPTPKGTAPPRNRIFAEAKTEYVACIDPHVLLYPGFFLSLDLFYADHGADCPDLLHGPMMTEGDAVLATHMNDQWRAEMWGTWGRAWVRGDHRHSFEGNKCTRCGVGITYQRYANEPCPKADYKLFSVLTRNDRDLEYVSLESESEQRTLSCEEVGLPPLQWSCHEKRLEELGCRSYLAAPFPVPGHGMGFFACRKDAWLPFHPDCRGFGGEEMTTGYRYRQAGRKCWCVPGAKWWHHFHRPTVPYRLVKWDRIHNYVCEFKRLGLDPTPIRGHFGAVLSAEEWADALAGKAWPDPRPNVRNYGGPPADLAGT